MEVDADRNPEETPSPTSRRTCRGTPTPTVSAKTISSAPRRKPAGEIEHVTRVDGALEGQPNDTPIVTVARRPSACACATIHSAAATDSATEAF